MMVADHCPLCGSYSVKPGRSSMFYEPLLDDWVRKGYLNCHSCGAHVPVMYNGNDDPIPAWRLNGKFDDTMAKVSEDLAHLKRQATDSPNGLVNAEVVEGVCMRMEELLKPWRCGE